MMRNLAKKISRHSVLIPFLRSVVVAWCGLLAAAGTAMAETSTVRVGWGVGTTYLPLYVMADQKLLEKQAEKLGIEDLKTEWSTFGTANAMNDALLSNSIDFASGGVSTFMPLWAKTKNSLGVSSVGALSAMPMYLVTTKPGVKSVADFTSDDRIAVAGLKVSYQALILQMAAEQAFGKGHHDRLDSMMVARSNSDGVIALLSKAVTAHLSPPPFATRELNNPATHLVLKSYDVLGGPATLTLVWGSQKFRDKNPKVFQAFYKALVEAHGYINADISRAAELYLRVSGDTSSSINDIKEIIGGQDVVWSIVPNGTFKVAQFMNHAGLIHSAPKDWKELYVPELHEESGS